MKFLARIFNIKITDRIEPELYAHATFNISSAQGVSVEEYCLFEHEGDLWQIMLITCVYGEWGASMGKNYFEVEVQRYIERG